jgi:hypothetical protein
MKDEPVVPMSVENVEKFDVWIHDSQHLEVSVVPHQAPWNTTLEDYEICES